MINHMNTHQTTLKIKHLFLVLLMAAILTPLAASAGIYKWTDEDGNVHYGSQRPADATSERMNIKSSTQPYSDPGAATDTKEDTKNESKKEGEEEKKPETVAPKPPEEPRISRKEKNARCEQARKSIQTIVTRGRVRVKLEDGTTRHMTDSERSKRLAQARKNVAQYCK